ncbi:MAG: hypothetical protein PVI70_05765 [Gammaproteobacteria bacterium]
MKLRSCLGLTLILGASLPIPGLQAHPYDSPLEFRRHLTDDGRVIYSNIPKKCFHHGVLTCDRLHPIFPKTSPDETPESSEEPQNSPQ